MITSYHYYYTLFTQISLIGYKTIELKFKLIYGLLSDHLLDNSNVSRKSSSKVSLKSKSNTSPKSAIKAPAPDKPQEVDDDGSNYFSQLVAKGHKVKSISQYKGTNTFREFNKSQTNATSSSSHKHKK